jgi:hypothetical protein
MIMERIFLFESDKEDITNKHEEIDRKLMNFLLRRAEKKERQIGDDEYPINVTEISFSDLPGYGFNSFSNRKDMERKIINMLEENEIADLGTYNTNYLDKNRQRIIKTIRYFLNFIMPKRQS